MIMMGDKKKMIGAILGPEKQDEPESEGMDALHALSEELIDAIHAKDAPGVASALQAAFEEMDSEPHVEGPHIED